MILDDFSLAGKIAVVTGASTGLGKNMAIGLAQAGATIVGVYNTHKPVEVASEINSFGGVFHGLRYDLTVMENIQRVIDDTVNICGKVDIVLNNSGICPRAPITEATEAEYDMTVSINQKTVYFLTQAAIKQFVKQGTRGKVINIASMLSFVGGIKASIYSATKHAVVGITRAMASEAAVLGCNVNAIAPGYMATPLAKPLMDDPERNGPIVFRIPDSRGWGDPASLRGAVVFLSSPASDYINGIVLPVDGGYLTR